MNHHSQGWTKCSHLFKFSLIFLCCLLKINWRTKSPDVCVLTQWCCRRLRIGLGGKLGGMYEHEEKGWQGIFHDIWRRKWVTLGAASLLLHGGYWINHALRSAEQHCAQNGSPPSPLPSPPVPAMEKTRAFALEELGSGILLKFCEAIRC